MKKKEILRFIRTIRQIGVGYMYWVWYYLSPKYRRSHGGVAIRRLMICHKCEHFTRMGRCRSCGCFMFVKVKRKYDIDSKGIARYPAGTTVCNYSKW